MQLVRRTLGPPKRAVGKKLTRFKNDYHKRKILSEYRDEEKLILHYMPEFSGGASTSIIAIIEALYDFQHILVSMLGFQRDYPVVVEAQRFTNTRMLQQTFTPENIDFVERLPQAVIMNHAFGFGKVDLITKDQLRRKSKVITFIRSQSVYAETDPLKTDTIVLFTRNFENTDLNRRYNDARCRVVHIPNAVNPERFPQAVTDGNLRNGKFVIGNITNGAPWKYSDDFVELCKDVSTPDVHYLLLGAFRLAPFFHGDPRFEILQPFSIDVPTYHKQISILIHRTRSDKPELWPRVIAEAMCAGIPVIADNRGGIRDQIIHGETGFLCENIEDFHRYIDLLYSDVGLYNKVSRSAREFALRVFNPEAFRRNLLSIISY